MFSFSVLFQQTMMYHMDVYYNLISFVNAGYDTVSFGGWFFLFSTFDRQGNIRCDCINGMSLNIIMLTKHVYALRIWIHTNDNACK